MWLFIIFFSGCCVQSSVFYAIFVCLHSFFYWLLGKPSMCFNIMDLNCLFDMDKNMFDSKCTISVFKDYEL
ncbi:hypothetical protein HanIR_Chr12g0608661 [Helianthus annuus]|nr:hypothetical protein HanIR_Chr12g0608661 [Helianthus annuus]